MAFGAESESTSRRTPSVRLQGNAGEVNGRQWLQGTLRKGVCRCPKIRETRLALDDFERHVASDPTAETEKFVAEIAATQDHSSGKPLADLDPRALPFLPFDLGRRKDEDLGLETPEGRAAFRESFGPARTRRDARGVEWRLNRRAFHGRDVLSVRGQELCKGLHWDVQLDRGSADLCMADEVWNIKRSQYLNIYPDMHTRSTRRGGRKVWPKNR